MGFPAHGHFSIETQHRCVFLTIYGAFNHEGAAELIEALNQCILDNFDDEKPWAVLFDLREFDLGTPDIVQLGKDAYQFARNHGQKFEAIVGFDNSVQQEQIQQLLGDVIQDIEVKVFSDLLEAKKWLRQCAML